MVSSYNEILFSNKRNRLLANLLSLAQSWVPFWLLLFFVSKLTIWKEHGHTETCISAWMFTTELLIIAWTWEQPKCPSHQLMNRWTKCGLATPWDIQFSPVSQSCPTLCNPVDCSMPGLPFHHQLPEFTQTHVHWVSDAIQPSHPLPSPFPPAFNLS